VLCWGHTGILSLGQGVFFGLGGFCMAAFLKLESLERRQHQDPVEPGHPRLHGLEPDHRAAVLLDPFNISFTLIAVVAVPPSWPSSSASPCSSGGSVASILPSSRRRSRGDDILIVAGRAYEAASTASRICARCSAGTFARQREYVSFRLLLPSARHDVSRALRDVEQARPHPWWRCATRRTGSAFSGYDVANFKIFVFCLASANAALGGAMFTLQVGFMSPSFVGIVPSIEMVIFCAVGGRHSLVGAVVARSCQLGKTLFSESSRSCGCCHGRLVHRGRARLPRGLAGLVTDSSSAAHEPRRLRPPRAEPAPAE